MGESMKHPHLLGGLLLAAGFSIALPAQAALQGRDMDGNLATYEAYYDTNLNITWLADANLAATNTFGVGNIYPTGGMSGDTAQNWIGAMNSANYFGYNDWRLPVTPQYDPTCSSQSGGDSYGVGCTGSEMGHLFYTELGGVAGSSITLTHNANYSLFQNVAADYYWSGSGYPPNNAYHKWAFVMSSGYQYWYLSNIELSVWAVRDGDVAAIPEADTWAMFLAGLGLVGVVARRRNAS